MSNDNEDLDRQVLSTRDSARNAVAVLTLMDMGSEDTTGDSREEWFGLVETIYDEGGLSAVINVLEAVGGMFLGLMDIAGLEVPEVLRQLGGSVYELPGNDNEE